MITNLRMELFEALARTESTTTAGRATAAAAATETRAANPTAARTAETARGRAAARGAGRTWPPAASPPGAWPRGRGAATWTASGAGAGGCWWTGRAPARADTRAATRARATAGAAAASHPAASTLASRGSSCWRSVRRLIQPQQLLQQLQQLPQLHLPLAVKNCVLVPQQMNMLVTGAPKVTVSAAPME